MSPRDLHVGPGRLAAVLEPRRGAGPFDVHVRASAEPPDNASVDDLPVDDLPVDGAPPDVAPPDDAPTVPFAVVTPSGRAPSGRAPAGRASGRVARLADRWLPAAWRGARLDPRRPGALALLLTTTVAALLATVGVWRQAPRAEPVPALPALVDTATVAAPPGPAPTTGPPEPIVVAVAGRVVRPGLVRVPAGARVADVLDAAGGVLPGTDLAEVNLARRVSDGEQVAVGVPPAADAVAAPAPSGTPAAGAPVDLNTATVEQLDALPGVGPVTAQRIVEWRTRNGRFATVDQLREVDGIGERRFGQLRALVRV